MLPNGMRRQQCKDSEKERSLEMRNEKIRGHPAGKRRGEDEEHYLPLMNRISQLFIPLNGNLITFLDGNYAFDVICCKK